MSETGEVTSPKTGPSSGARPLNGGGWELEDGEAAAGRPATPATAPRHADLRPAPPVVQAARTTTTAA
ncbi:MAG: hypothetical protein ACRDNL_10825, partial [Spirillospora sp.]